jgi:hypothetical protein
MIVLTAEPAMPAIKAPIIAEFTNCGRTVENQSAIPGKERYPINPMPNPRSQNENIAIPLDIIEYPSQNFKCTSINSAHSHNLACTNWY